MPPAHRPVKVRSPHHNVIKEIIMKKVVYALAVLGCFLMTPAVFADQGLESNSYGAVQKDPCKSFVPASTGGPVPAKGSSVLTWRWLGNANIELTYKNQIILFSAYFFRGPRNPAPIPVEQVTKADAIFLGHAHFDHMSDAALVGKATGATVYGEEIAYNKLLTQDIPAGQLHKIKSGDIIKFNGFTVEAIHVFHSGVDGDIKGPTPTMGAALRAFTDAAWGGPMTAEETAVKDALFATGSNDPNIRTKGVLAYLFTFGKDFRVLLYDSGSTVLSDDLKAKLDSLVAGGKRLDVASVAYAGGHSHTQVPYTMFLTKLFNARLFIPNHHDEGSYDMNMEKFFQAIRDEAPNTEVLSPLYKEPVCFNVTSKVATKVSPVKGSTWTYNMKQNP
jgi:L-ascorbate metabolism protein UlaG (beta-lactamase superfamily)